MPINWSLIPTSTRTNPYDVLKEEIIPLIRTEPLRIEMQVFASTAPVYHGLTVNPKELPGCGMQGCIAGWLGVTRLQDTRGFHLYTLGSKFVPKGVRDDWKYLIFGRPPYAYPSCLMEPVEYAEAVIANIEKFLATHEAELKAYTIPKGW